MKHLLTLLICILFIAPNLCSQTYEEEVENQGLTFTVPISESENAWSRAQTWIALYGGMHVQTVSDYIITTYNPTDYYKLSYSVTRTHFQEHSLITIICYGVHGKSNKITNKNAKLLAYYVKTGEFKPEYLQRVQDPRIAVAVIVGIISIISLLPLVMLH